MSESTPAPSGHKRCNGPCGKILPVTQFSRRTDRPHNYVSKCKACKAEQGRQWRVNNPGYDAAYYVQNREKKIAAACEYQKLNPVDPEYRRVRRRKWRAVNVDRCAEVDRAWRANNAERIAQVDRAWRESNPERVLENARRARHRRRARLRGLPSEPYTIGQLIERDGTLCVLCGEELDLDARPRTAQAVTIEHLECVSWPNSAGDVRSNVALAHFSCNTKRRTKPHPAAARKREELLADQLLT